MRGKNCRGFTLIELLIVVAIIGLIAAIAVPSLMNAIDRGKQSSTVANIRAIGTAVEHYAIDNNRYPSAANIQELRQALEPIYTPQVPTVDGWKHPLIYQPGPSGLGYTICSPGKDGKLDGSSPGGATHSFSADIIFTRNSFTQWPEGTQQQD